MFHLQLRDLCSKLETFQLVESVSSGKLHGTFGIHERLSSRFPSVAYLADNSEAISAEPRDARVNS